MFTSKLFSTFLNSLKNATKLTTRILATSLTLKRIHILLLADIINLNRFLNFRSLLLNPFKAYETGKLKEAGALILKARQLLDASEPKRETTKTLHSTISSHVQSSSSSIQAALVLPATQSTKKGQNDPSFVFLRVIIDSSFDKENVLKNLGDFGAQFGTIEFPPALKPIPAKATLFDIAGDKGWIKLKILSNFFSVFNFPNLEDKVEKKQSAGDSKGITGRLGGWLGWGAK